MSLLEKPVYLFADGASQGNPGPGGLGYLITHSKNIRLKDFLNNKIEIISYGKKFLGYTTNNQAEYEALLAGIEEVKAKNFSSVIVLMDSELVINQMKGLYKIKNAHLKVLHEKAQKLAQNLKIDFVHIRREFNQVADYLARLAIEQKIP